jgi:3-oxoacyl-[acyl-carrier-protein] synthase II
MRRVVVTGIGAVSPLGANIEDSWSNLLKGHSGASKINHFKVDDLACQIACMVKTTGDGAFNADDWIEPKDQKRLDQFIIYGIAAAEMAIQDSGYVAQTEEQQFRAGVLIGSGIGGLNGIVENALVLEERGPRRISPFFIPSSLINLVSGQVSIRHQMKGPNHSVVTACSTGAHAIGDAARLIQMDDADVMIAGGAEAAIGRLGFAGFVACRAMSTHFNETPELGSRPYDRDRDGFVMGEGSGIVVLEEYEHAKKRGAKIYGEVIGYGLSGDAYHITSPAPDGSGGYRSMQMALKKANVPLSEVGYVNAHGTSTPMGDEIELKAVEKLFGSASGEVKMSSTKSSVGHLLGAAGSLEAIFCLLAMRDSIVPPTINLDNPSVDSPIDLIPNTAKEVKLKTVLSNSFGFGGTNASLVFRAVE